MSFATNARRRGLVFLTASAMVAGLGVVATTTAKAAEPCAVKVTKLALDNGHRFKSGGLLKRYTAAVDYPAGTTYDQHAKAVLAKYPSNAWPTLLHAKIGKRVKTGDMVKAQEPRAISAITGDFFVTPTIRGRTLEIARGPMIKNGNIIRATRHREKVVGVGIKGRPFGGEVGLRGSIQSGDLPRVELQAVNWQRVKRGGVTIYTSDWNAASDTPRPTGDAEWVINAHNKIKQVRTSTKNTGKLGAPVRDGTRVIAFSQNSALVAEGGHVDTKVNVSIRQSTDNGVKLLTAIGRGMPLVVNGVAAPAGCDAYDHSKAARPRTMIGWTKAGNWRTFTVPGKKFVGPGLRVGGFGLAAEAAIAKKLGLWQAFEIDGGGSTTLYTQSSGGKWTRRDLYGFDTSTGTYEREMTNGLAFLTP